MASKTKTDAPVAKTSNAVHKDIIIGENIRKEIRYQDRNIMKHFQLNPNNGTFPLIFNHLILILVYLMPEKPNYINPSKRQSELLSGKLVGGFTDDPVGKQNL